MQSTIFLPGCYSSRDLNVGANGGAWPLYNNERTLNGGHSYNVFMPLPNDDQFLVYDKQVLRQTMLKHDYIFRDQVHELHRLYRRQRELMDTIKRRELSKQSLQLQTSQSNSFLPKISSDSAPKTWQIPSLPWVNPAASRSSISSVDNFQSMSSFSEWKRARAAPDAAETDGNLEDHKLLHSTCEKPKKYIDSEEEDQFGEEKVSKVPELPCYSPKRMPEVSQKIDLKLFPCGGPVNSICQAGSSSPGTFSRRTNDLADLNEPIWLEDAVALNAVNFLGSDSFHKGIPCQERELSGKSNSGFQAFSKEIVSNIQTGRAVEACLNSKHPEKGKQQELPPRNEEAAGKRISNLNCLSQVSSSGKLSMPFEQLKVELPTEFPVVNLLDECNRTSVLETSERNHNLSNDGYRGLASSCLPTSYQLCPQFDVAKLEPSSVSSLRKQNPKTVQALPGFKITVPSCKSTESSRASSLLNGNGFHCNRNMSSSPGVGSLNPLGNSFCIGSQSESRTEACSPSISFNHLNSSNANGFPSEVHKNCFRPSIGRDVNFAKCMDLNMPPSCLLDSEVSQQNVGTEDGVKMLDYSNKHNEEREDLPPTDLVFSQAFPTSVCDAEPKRFKTSECPGNEKILGSSNFEKPHVSTEQFFALASSSNSHPDACEDKDIKSNQEAGMLDINLASCPVLNSQKQCSSSMDDVSVDITVGSKLSRVGNQFDLNCCINEDESSPTLSISRVKIKTVAEMDLEAPVSPENKECLPPRGESEENQLETPIQLSKHEDRDQKDELVRMAAEAIVLISTPEFQKLLLENTDCETVEDSPSDSLHWFAGVVSSMAGDLENEVGVVLSGKDGSDQQELSSDGSYYFEAMTLELTETKVEEYSCKSNGQKEEETDSVLSSPSQPRRGRTRRGRQCKDFQTEVLPSLASLSRHEVTEDLHIIGGLMEAAGFHAETSLGRRNVSRCSRARRRSGNSLCHGVENTVCSLLKQQNNDSELAFRERNLKGWGKINRRRRGPRIPASNPPHLFS